MIDRSKILATSFHLLNLNRTHVLLEATYWSPTQLCKRRCLSELCLKSCSRLPMARMLASACLAPTFALLQTPTMGLKYSRKRFEQLYSSLNKSKQFPATFFNLFFVIFKHSYILKSFKLDLNLACQNIWHDAHWTTTPPRPYYKTNKCCCT